MGFLSISYLKLRIETYFNCVLSCAIEEKHLKTTNFRDEEYRLQQ